MRRLRVLRGFAYSRLPPAEANDGEMQRMLGGARPFHPGEYDFLAAKLPGTCKRRPKKGVNKAG